MTATSTRSRPLRRAATCLALLLLLLCAPALVGGAAAATTTTTATSSRDGDAVEVTLTSVSPVALTPDARLTVTGTATNTSGTAVTGLEVRLRLDWQVVTDEDDIAAWSDTGSATDGHDGTVLATRDLGTVAAGATVQFTLAVAGSAAGLPETASSFGPRRTTVEAVGDAGSGSGRLGTVRTFVVWAPVDDYTPTTLTLLAPVTSASAVTPVGSGDDDAGTDAGATVSPEDEVVSPLEPVLDDALAAGTAGDGQLERLLTAVADPAFSYLVDPAVPGTLAAVLEVADGADGGVPGGAGTASQGTDGASGSGDASATGTASGEATAGGTSPTVTATGAGEAGTAAGTGTAGGSGVADGTDATTDGTGTADATEDGTDAETDAARSWLQRFVEAAGTRDVAVLPYADPDLVALSRGSAGALIDVAVTDAATSYRSATGETAEVSVAWPADGLIDSSTLQRLSRKTDLQVVLSSDTVDDGSDDVLPAHRTVSSGSASVDALVAEQTLSDALAGTGGQDSVLATQQLLAGTAAVTAQDRDAGVSVLATGPRGWDPDPVLVQESLATLRSAPWITLGGLDELTATEPAGTGSTLAGYPGAQADQEVPAARVAAVVRQLNRLLDFAPVLAEPEELVGPARRLALSLVGLARRSGDTDRSTEDDLALLRSTVADLYSGVGVVSGSAANMLAKSGQLPVTLSNRLTQTVDVVLRLHPTSGRVLTREAVAVQIEAGKSLTVNVPIEALANGDVEIGSQVYAPDAADGTEGVLLSAAPAIRLRVHSDWESRGLIGAAVLLAVLVVVGLVRSVRRGRQRVDPAGVPDRDDEAVAAAAAPGADGGETGPPGGGSAPEGPEDPGDGHPGPGAGAVDAGADGAAADGAGTDGTAADGTGTDGAGASSAAADGTAGTGTEQATTPGPGSVPEARKGAEVPRRAGTGSAPSR